MSENNTQNKIGLIQVLELAWKKRWTFVKVWIITFVLSCIWILPQPRYYACEVSVSPESADAGAAGGLASLASSFGIDMGAMSQSDAIYPMLYPDLFESTDFIVGLLDIKIQTSEDSITTDYYTYMHDYQKKNYLTYPFTWTLREIKSLFTTPSPEIKGKNGKRFDPFHLSKETTDIIKDIKSNIKCSFSKTTNVVTIEVKDQDPLTCAILADSIKAHLQDFITDYRTKKARQDYEHYKQMTKDARESYNIAMKAYTDYSDSHQDVVLEAYKTKITDLENEMQQRYNLYTAMSTRMETALADVQQRTPVFTTLQNATVPIKPDGPKRMIFVAAMLILSTLGTMWWQFRKELKEWF